MQLNKRYSIDKDIHNNTNTGGRKKLHKIERIHYTLSAYVMCDKITL